MLEVGMGFTQGELLEVVPGALILVFECAACKQQVPDSIWRSPGNVLSRESARGL
jgi:hypothetical protein